MDPDALRAEIRKYRLMEYDRDEVSRIMWVLVMCGFFLTLLPIARNSQGSRFVFRQLAVRHRRE